MTKDIKRVRPPVSGLVDDMLNQLNSDPVEIERIDNTTEALREYCSQLVDEIMAMPIQDAQETPSIIGQYHDIADELYRRDIANIHVFDLDNAILSDMTSAVLTAQKLASLEETQELPAIDPCESHFSGGWYIDTNGNRWMAVPPHMGVDAEKACSKCRGWLSYPEKFSHWA